MLRALAAAFVLFVGVSIVSAEEFFGLITKVEGNKVTITKFKKGEKGGEPVTLTASDSVKVLKGTFNKDTKKFEAGPAVEGGLKNEMFSTGKALARIVTDDTNTITEIRVSDRKKKDN